MREALFHVERSVTSTLQAQIREALVSAVLSGQMPPGEPVPSTRAMAKRLKVSRNTVVLAYQSLVDDGFLESRERSGFFANPDVLEGLISAQPDIDAEPAGSIDWNARIKVNAAAQENIEKPANWRSYPYPFIYGQADPALFPIAEWRECSRQSLGTKWIDAWTEDRFAEDDPMLVEQIRQRILPRRGIRAAEDEILITLGAQNALYLLSRLLVDHQTSVAIEDPGYADVRNILRLRTDRIHPIPVDREGVIIHRDLARCDVLYTTPSHQFPTTATMTIERRKALLAAASRDDFVVIEDDYEFETNYISEPCPALKSLDRDGRVIYVGSLSKSLVPGLRIGFMVAPKALIREARALRRLMLRHPPGNNQRTVALFLAMGHHDTLIGRLHRVYRERWKILGEALEAHLPGWTRSSTFGGTSFWLEGPTDLDASVLAEHALERGVVIERGATFFARSPAPKNFFRLGFSSIATERIEPGIELLAGLVRDRTT